MKLICTTFLFLNSYCIICERTVIDGRQMRPCVLFCESCGRLSVGLPREGKEKVEERVRVGGREGVITDGEGLVLDRNSIYTEES